MGIDVKEWAQRWVNEQEGRPNPGIFDTTKIRFMADLIRAVIAGEAAKTQPAEPRADDPLMPNWFCEGYAADDGAIFLWRKVIDELTRRVAEATAERDRRIAFLDEQCSRNQQAYYAMTEERDALKQQLATATAEVERLKRGNWTPEEANNICHNLHGVVSARGFADGCALEQQRLYGCAPDADEVARLKQQLTEATRPVEDVKGAWFFGGHYVQMVSFQSERAARVAAEAERDELREAWKRRFACVETDGNGLSRWSTELRDSPTLPEGDPSDAVLAAYREEKAKVAT